MDTTDVAAIKKLLADWASATREGRQNDVLVNHASELLIFDVLPPFKYDSAARYRASWEEWQPQTEGEMIFHLEDLEVFAGADVGYAHGILQCGGTMPGGRSFSDTVRATFGLRKVDRKWIVFHQHISKPYERNQQ